MCSITECNLRCSHLDGLPGVGHEEWERVLRPRDAVVQTVLRAQVRVLCLHRHLKLAAVTSTHTGMRLNIGVYMKKAFYTQTVYKV